MKKKIISFSLYGDTEYYRIGALKNLELQKAIYPDWSCRYYVSQEIPKKVVSKLQDMGAEIHHKERKHEADGRFWRFLPAGEYGIDAVIVRDVDSRLSQREKNAVDEWLRSKKDFHIMRDHPVHRKLIMAGMWGCLGNTLPWIERKIERWGRYEVKDDQEFLAHVVYPKIRRTVFIHTDLCPFRGEICHPFPDKRLPGEFVGRIFKSANISDEELKSTKTQMDNAKPKLRHIPESVLRQGMAYRMRSDVYALGRRMLPAGVRRNLKRIFWIH